MKFRRALVTVATTAAIAPAALMTAPSAFAASAVPSANADVVPSAASAGHPATTSSASGLCMTGNPKYRPVLRTALTGLPNKIAAGSGWHNFTLTIDNPSQSRFTNIHLFAGVSSTYVGFKAFPTSQVSLQAYFPKIKRWEDVTDTAGHTDGYFGWGWLSGHTHINVPMRINVKKNAPIGKALALGAGLYQDAAHKCTAITAVNHKMQIVAPARHTR
ncbi:hypothetical protein [Streptomyces sp. RPT161]|uniref:hypothetical protein n=1 Tax=Streptomyces sp. RPT161 TaxID=3015993 RepID=UPI0022B8C1D4|nr:hypothetical protein [Streptomyces sp. RPT161]